MARKEIKNKAVKDFSRYVASGQPFVWIQTTEYERVVELLSTTIEEYVENSCYMWDVNSGINPVGKEHAEITVPTNDEDEEKLPERPIDFLLEDDNDETVMFALDYHEFLNSDGGGNVDIYRKLLNASSNFKTNLKTFAVVSAITEIPVEIRDYFTVIKFPLPKEFELEEAGEKLVEDLTDSNYIDEHRGQFKKIVKAGMGLSLFDFESVLSLSYAQNRDFDVEAVQTLKEQKIRQNGFLNVVKFNEGFESLKGLDNLKEFSKKLIEGCKAKGEKAKGILLVGVPGAGKSHFAKALGNETNRLAISMDLEKLKGQYVGQTEQNTAAALATIDAVVESILFVDEIEKGLSGVGNSGQTDGGSSAGQFSLLLKWMQDKESDSFLVATSNDISKLPAELMRAGRFDAIFFCDLPTKEERTVILKHYKEVYKITSDESIKDKDIEGWTGAEIESICNKSYLLDIPLKEAKKYITPIIKTKGDDIQNLRQWAKGRTIPASIYKEKEKKKKDTKIQSLN